MTKVISKVFAIKKEVELKSEYLDSYLDMAIKIVTTVKTERFDKFLKLVGGNRK